jgi:hypothetical protein
LNAITKIFTEVDQDVLLSVAERTKVGDQARGEEIHKVTKKQETLLHDWRRKPEDTNSWTALYLLISMVRDSTSQQNRSDGLPIVKGRKKWSTHVKLEPKSMRRFICLKMICRDQIIPVVGGTVWVNATGNHRDTYGKVTLTAIQLIVPLSGFHRRVAVLYMTNPFPAAFPAYRSTTDYHSMHHQLRIESLLTAHHVYHRPD